MTQQPWRRSWSGPQSPQPARSGADRIVQVAEAARVVGVRVRACLCVRARMSVCVRLRKFERMCSMETHRSSLLILVDFKHERTRSCLKSQLHASSLPLGG